MNNLKRLPFIRSGKPSHLSPTKSMSQSAAAFHTNGHLEADSPDTRSPGSRRNSSAGSILLQVPSLDEPGLLPSHPHLDKERGPWEIDSARNSALAHIRSKSVSCLAPPPQQLLLPPETDVPRVKITLQKIRRKSREIQSDVEKKVTPTKKLALHRRSHSAVGLSPQDSFDLGNAANLDAISFLKKDGDMYRSSEMLTMKEPSRRNSTDTTFLTQKSNTFPRQVVPIASTPTLGKKLLKSMSLMSSPVRHLSNFLSPNDQVSR